MKPKFLEPTTSMKAAALLGEYGEDAKIIAGGTAIVLMLQQRLIAPTALISLGRVNDNRDIYLEEDGLHIGALALLSEAERSKTLKQFSPALAHSFSVVGNVRIRNQATVGGNLAEADYASDPPAMLLALDARVKTLSRRGEREIPLDEFFLGFYTTALEPDEIITEIVVPNQSKNSCAVYLKYTSRSMEDRPCVGVAAVVDLEVGGKCKHLHIAIGAAVETPQRLPEIEEQAKGEILSDELIQDIVDGYAKNLDTLEDARGSAWYRKEMIRVHVRRALMELRDDHR